MNDFQLMATVFAASDPRMLGKFPDSNVDELWVADIKACLPGGDCRVFRSVMFVESNGAAFIFGIEHEDGRPRGVKVELAERQQLFIDFLREQNEISDLAMGGLRALFPRLGVRQPSQGHSGIHDPSKIPYRPCFRLSRSRRCIRV